MFRSVFCFIYICFGVLSSEVLCENSLDLSNIGNIELLQNIAFRKSNENLKASLNDYLDQIVSRVNTQIDYPIIIPDYNISVNTDILVLPIVGNLKFYNGAVKEIGTVSRSGDAPVTYIDDILTINLALDVKNVKFTGDFVAKFESIGPSGSMTGIIEEIALRAALKVDVNKIQMQLTDFHMNAGTIDLSVDILPVLNYFLNSLIKLLVYIIQWPLLSMISSDIKTQVQTLLDSYTQIFQ